MNTASSTVLVTTLPEATVSQIRMKLAVKDNLCQLSPVKVVPLRIVYVLGLINGHK